MKRPWYISLIWAISLNIVGVQQADAQGPESLGPAQPTEDLLARLRAADQLDRQGEYAAAKTILLAALKAAESLGSQDARTAVVLNYLGTVNDSLGQYLQAEMSYRRAIEIGQNVWPVDDDHLIQCKANLAALYIEIGDCAKAERLGLRAVAQRMEELGREDQEMGRLLTTLGTLSVCQSKYSEAEGYETESLAIWERLGSDPSEIMRNLNNLAVIYWRTGRNHEALSCYKRALNIAEKTLSPEHPTMASILSNVGTFHFLVHGPSAAEPFYKKALAIAETRLGPEHPLVGEILSYYAAVLHQTQREGEAKQYQRRAKAIREAAFAQNPRQYTVDIRDLLRQSRKQ